MLLSWDKANTTAAYTLTTVVTPRMGHYTNAPEDNLLGLTDKDLLNEQ
ncbi:hypothetical protein [Hymenobacter glacieicola]|uniref:Uncharacterized protein n=1 Tax=Hymenobacter glacieicola TaxID=1562124 RepID=A0ABQ1X540_9BACT|nr:hypothetical protein [Hymenobacter glacieicola]GGG60416.1 hypothetical protein GCM10011378_40500 [Hymenobacter glacieicola]